MVEAAARSTASTGIRDWRTRSVGLEITVVALGDAAARNWGGETAMVSPAHRPGARPEAITN